MRKNRDLHLEKLKGGLSENDGMKIDAFFDLLSERIDLPILNKTLLTQHFIDGFDYYLEKGFEVSEICELLDPGHLGTFYSGLKRQPYSLDNAAIVYPLGMKYGQMPMFRLSAQLREYVEPVLLQLALDFTIKRFPTFSAVIKNGFFWHYLETTNALSLVEEERDIPCKPISIILRTYRSMRVLYYRKRVSVEFFHVLTDGTGGMVFLKTLLSEYLRLKQIVVRKENGVLDVDGEIDEAELVNEFANAKGEARLSTFVDRKSLQIDGKLSRLNLTKIVHFEMDPKKLHEKARSYGGTVTAYMTALIFMAAEKCISRKEGIFNIQIPVNMRKFNGSKTLRNYSMYFNASRDISEISDLKTLVRDIDAQIKEKGSQKMMNQMMMTTRRLISSLSFIPLFLKVPIMQMVYGYLGNRIIGCNLSNLGVVEFPDGMKEEIEKIYFVMPPGSPNRFTTTLATAGDTSIFSVMRSSKDSSIEEELFRLLNGEGLIRQIEGSVDYES